MIMILSLHCHLSVAATMRLRSPRSASAATGGGVERDDLSLNCHLALSFGLSMIFPENRCTFPDLAPACARLLLPVTGFESRPRLSPDRDQPDGADTVQSDRRSIRFQLKLQHRVSFISKVKSRQRLRAEPEALWLSDVLVIPQCRQTHPPQGHAGRVDVLRAVCGGQLFCKRATCEPLRPAKGGQADAHRRCAASCQLIRFACG